MAPSDHPRTPSAAQAAATGAATTAAHGGMTRERGADEDSSARTYTKRPDEGRLARGHGPTGGRWSAEGRQAATEVVDKPPR